MSRSVAANAELALLLEVASTPKPGNVDRHREYPALRFEQFLAGAVGTRSGFASAAAGEPVGRAIERAVAGMSDQDGGNTQFGAVLAIAPLAAAAGRSDTTLSPDGVSVVVAETTVEDTVGFYRAFDHVDVAVGDPPEELAALDVRRGSEAVSAVRERGLALAELLAESADVDDIAREWTRGFPRTFCAAEEIAGREGPVTDRAAAVFLELLADRLDTFVITKHGRETASEVRRRARAALNGTEDVDALAAELVDRGINPGTTADLVAAALFVALQRGTSP
ncbi:triphosphoribosyl-dephospho-CoA synthase [Halobacteriales archaeon QH_10_67_13]|nr:MAG: triphosphoribosyl-dephospho-CoA synthase [Halobacteriales archaeon QH_10_67_13]